MPGSVKKDLYVAKTVHELNRLAEDIPKVTNARLYATTAEKVYRGAEEAFMLGDEERSYVLYMKYFNVVSAIKKSADYKKQTKFVEDLIGKKNCLNAITKAEQLAASLKTRYEELEALEVSKKLDKLEAREDSKEEAAEAGEKKQPDQDGDSAKDAAASKDVKESPAVGVKGGIDIRTVYRLMNDPQVSLILMDARSDEDYQRSHFLSEKSISVPESAVLPGCTVTQIEKNLPPESLKVWRTRGRVDYVILFDWRCSAATLAPRSTLTYLKDALYKWDQETILRCEPLILEGGYEEWLLCYPSLTTNADVKCPLPSNGANSDLPSLDSIDYDVELEFLKSPTPSPATPPVIPPGMTSAAPAFLPPSSGPTLSAPYPTMPAVDRTKKPRPAAPLNNANNTARVDSVPGTSGGPRVIDKISNSTVSPAPTSGPKKSTNSASTSSRTPDKNTNVARNVVRDPHPIAPIPFVDRSKKPATDQPVAHRVSSSSSDEEVGGSAARSEGGDLRSRKTSDQNREEAERRSLMELREAKEREVRILAEIMRKKKKVPTATLR